MRNVIGLALVLAACSSSGDGMAISAPDAGSPAVVSRGRQVPDQDTRQAQQLDARAALPDSMAADALVPVASPDALPLAPDTYVAPSPPLVTWEPGPEAKDPAMMVCPPTKGNSLGIGKACSNDVGGVRCPAGTYCLCGGAIGAPAPLIPKSMPCMCTADVIGDMNANVTCPPCGDGAGCCTLRGNRDAQWVCLPNSCATSFCRVDSPK